MIALRALFTFLVLCSCAFSQSGLRSPSFVANLNPPSTGGSAPAAPTGISIDYVSSAPFFEIHWTDPAGTDFGIELWTSVDGGGSAIETGGIGEGTMLAIAAGAIADTHVYIYKVRATNSFGASAFSASITNDIFIDATHYWNLNQTAGNARTDSIGGTSLTEGLTTTASGTGIKGNAADFRGQNTDCLTNWNATLSATFSVGLWINADDLGLSDTQIAVFGDGNGGAIMMLTTSGDVRWKSIVDSDIATVALGALNSWHFICATWDGSTLQLSVDGAAYATGSIYDATFSPGIFIGGPGTGCVSALIDESSTWPRVLSQVEVTSIAAGRFK